MKRPIDYTDAALERYNANRGDNDNEDRVLLLDEMVEAVRRARSDAASEIRRIVEEHRCVGCDVLANLPMIEALRSLEEPP